MGLFTSGAAGSVESSLNVSEFWITLGSKPGIEAMTFTAPVSGSRATTEPPTPGATAAVSWSTASRWASASRVSVMSAPSGGMSRSWSMIEANSFCSPERWSFSASSIPVLPTST